MSGIPEHRVGTELPPLDVPLDRTTIAATAIASQDFEDVHHDPSKAQQRGTPDIFMSINATNGFLNRYVTDWAGPHARILRTGLRLGVPAFPGDVLRFTGEVTDIADGRTTLKIKGANERGVHVSAEMVLTCSEGAQR
ncbi:MaoC/PaaZ C-terminal domain-containing protein [Enemella sp. A6]|uniref:MaoC/PaaZ C-terminal domain-containing protein n=1 Tax=Enemella sp. A6 TaxID=3440152 RepID=UPI003EB910D3